MREVTELTGKAPSIPGNRAMRLQIRAREAPHNNVPGRRMRWSAVRKMPRQICGTARPRNIIGPQ